MLERIKKIKVENPLDTEMMIGSQVSQSQMEKILGYINIGKEEGAEVLSGGSAGNYEGDISYGYYIQQTILKGNNKTRVFQKEIFGPVVALTTFSSTEEAIEIANDTICGLGTGDCSRDAHELFQVPKAIHAVRVWLNQYNTDAAQTSFGGVKKSGFGRYNHKLALDHYRQVKNMLVSYDKELVGFF
jgi:acyl-CoA reductase-like NAD-dependent aldehyde dehydrogenase